MVFKQRSYTHKRQPREKKLDREYKVCFCTCEETIQHLFFDCHFASFLWRLLVYIVLQVSMICLQIGYLELDSKVENKS
jgi:hypothetical protein